MYHLVLEIFFSIACQESTDIGGTAQLVVFIRVCVVGFNIFQVLLFDKITREDVFVSVSNFWKKNHDLPPSKLSSMAVGGAIEGFVERLNKTNGNVECKFHTSSSVMYKIH